MNLQGRNLEPNLRGDDVKLLQSELRQLKLRTQIVDQEGFFGSTTFLAVQEFQRLHGLEATGIVDQRTAELINKDVDELGAASFVVRGEVSQAHGEPLRGSIVRLLRKGLRNDEPLGQATTSPAGAYSIEYQPAEKPISIVVQASDTTGNVLATSNVICKARPVEIVNLSTDGTSSSPTEFKQLQDRLTPILLREQMRVEGLEAADVQFIACAHDLNPEHVAYLVASSRMVRESRIESEVFYGLVRQKLPTRLVALVAEPPDVLREALESSISENVISARVKDQIPRILRDLQRQVVRLAIAEPTSDRPTLRTLFDIAGVPQERQQTLMSAYVERKGTVAEFWDGLRTQSGFEKEEIETLKYTVGAASITLNHAPLVQQLARLRVSGELGPDLRDLARFKQDDWANLIKNQSGNSRVGAPAVFGDDEEERETRYAEFLPRIVEALFPTTFLSHRLAEIDETRFAPTLTFLRNNPDFEFQKTPINEFLAANPQVEAHLRNAVTRHRAHGVATEGEPGQRGAEQRAA